MLTYPEQSVSVELFVEEQAELEAVIASCLRPNSNMARLLRYVCEKHFCGLTQDIREYNIAVEALHRPPTFDPARDSIVRVEAHRLRNRLERFYEKDGASHSVRIVIPTGSYVPNFEHAKILSDQPTKPATDVASPVLPVSAEVVSTSWWRRILPPAGQRKKLFSGMILSLCLVAVAVALHRGRTESLKSQAPVAAKEPSGTMGRAAKTVRIVAGLSSPTFIDSLGRTWNGDQGYTGGSAESVSPRAISFAQDPSMFVHRRRGTFSYSIPLNPGTYELRLYFADVFFGENNIDGGGEGSRVFDVKANGRSLLRNFDVISDAGGSNTGDVKVFENIQPDDSGKLRLDFLPKRDAAFVNAIEILPTPEGRTVPMRIVMQSSGYTDANGNWWEPDHFYRGGVGFITSSSSGKQVRGAPDTGGERFGNFVYSVPVAAGRVYRATLTFMEMDESHLLGETPQDRIDIFNVFANSRPLLENLQVRVGRGDAKPIRQTFRGLTPNAQDKLIFSFVPVHNYALVNSIEVVEDR